MCRSEVDFEKHMTYCHEDEFPADLFADFTQTCKVYEPRSLDMCPICSKTQDQWQLEEQHSDNNNSPAFHDCSGPHKVIDNSFATHIGTCMHKFALRSLPWPATEQNEASDSQTAAYSRSKRDDLSEISESLNLEEGGEPRENSLSEAALGVFSTIDALNLNRWLEGQAHASIQPTGRHASPTRPIMTWPTRDPGRLAIKVRKHIDEKRDWVADEHELYGRRSIITPHALQQCLPRHMIKALLCLSHDSDVDVVYQQYIRILGILIKIGAQDSIKYFLTENIYQDSRLPVLDAQSLPPASQHLFDKFFEAQWQFCAPELHLGQLHRKSLRSEQILPIMKRETLKQGADARVDKVTIYPEYNFLTLDQNGQPSTNTFVLKSYPEEKFDFYKTEVEAYMMLGNHDDIASNLVRFYGSWEQNKECSILLEYVGGGTLAKMLKETHPTTDTDRLKFWTQLIGILDPLCRIHCHTDPWDRSKVIEGIHQDIKPENILVSSDSLSQSAYDRTFKLVDLGSTLFGETSRSKGKARIRDSRGTPQFSAPECFRFEQDRVQYRTPQAAKPSKDIWSLGCVFSLAIVWSVLGSEKVIEYQQLLADATDEIPDLRGTSYSGCFHDGQEVLSVVKAMHREVLKALGGSYYSVGDMISITEDMLDTAEERPPAAEVRRRCRKTIQRATDLMYPETSRLSSSFFLDQGMRSRPQTLPQTLPRKLRSSVHTAGIGTRSLSPIASTPTGHAQDRVGGRSTRDSIIYSHQNEQMNDMELQQNAVRHHNRDTLQENQQGDKSMELPRQHICRPGRQCVHIEEVYKWIQGRKKNLALPPIISAHDLNELKDREQLFLIDNTSSTERFRSEMRQTLASLGYLVKSYDPDGIGLYFTKSDMQMREKKTTKLLAAFDNVAFDGEGGMESALGRMLEKFNERHLLRSLLPGRVKQWSIYVLTDGVWGNHDKSLCGIPQLLEDTVSKLSTRVRLGIQFIQFGDDPIGSWRLRMLDTQLRQYGVTQDIIDTTRYEGNVLKMLLGSFNSSWDDDEESRDWHESTPQSGPSSARYYNSTT